MKSSGPGKARSLTTLPPNVLFLLQRNRLIDCSSKLRMRINVIDNGTVCSNATPKAIANVCVLNNSAACGVHSSRGHKSNPISTTHLYHRGKRKGTRVSNNRPRIIAALHASGALCTRSFMSLMSYRYDRHRHWLGL